MINSKKGASDVRVTDRAYPSHLVFLHELKDLGLGTKVRFLACIEKFEVGSEFATFSYKSGQSSLPSVALVNLEAILGTLPPALLEVGSWLNIIGYIVEPPDASALGRNDKHGRSRSTRRLSCVQAIVAWSAGEMDLAVYEEGVRAVRGVKDGGL